MIHMHTVVVVIIVIVLCVFWHFWLCAHWAVAMQPRLESIVMQMKKPNKLCGQFHRMLPTAPQYSQPLARSHSHWYRFEIEFNSFSTFLFSCVKQRKMTKTKKIGYAIRFPCDVDQHESIIIVANLSLFLFGDNVIFILRFAALPSDSTNWFILSVICESLQLDFCGSNITSMLHITFTTQYNVVFFFCCLFIIASGFRVTSLS